MIDTHNYKWREREIRREIGVPLSCFDVKDSYSIYVNPKYGHITAFKDNIRGIFYKISDKKDMELFINTLNVKANSTSRFLQSIEKEFAMYQDREIEYFEHLRELEEEIERMETAFKRKYDYDLCDVVDEVYGDDE